MISYPLNFDDLTMFLNSNKHNMEGNVSEMIKIGLGLFDPLAFNNKSKQMKTERMSEDIKCLR